ncbi:hypothetical protein AMTR_s00021p00133720 [Amborella trichopoda]|uniref:Uncharacterized protein n=1 Tax=Amborella trichopoda TaxID=13333 RepID=W1PV87_AMBTC|nr:hypothetical protein AMTR_s00021p00133720 [Amborella trichopoda]
MFKCDTSCEKQMSAIIKANKDKKSTKQKMVEEIVLRSQSGMGGSEDEFEAPSSFMRRTSSDNVYCQQRGIDIDEQQ